MEVHFVDIYSTVEYVFRTLRRDLMRWFGIALAIAGVVAALVAWLVFENIPVVIGAAVLMVIGIIVFMYGTRTLPK